MGFLQITLMALADGKCICIQKILQPAHTVNTVSAFPQPYSKYLFGTQIPHCTACFLCTPLKTDIKSCPNAAFLTLLSKVRHNIL